MTKAMTLRLPDDVHEELRQEAFAERTSITALVLSAVRDRRRRAGSGCDVCGRPHVMVSTPGGIRFCERHDPRYESEPFVSRKHESTDP